HPPCLSLFPYTTLFRSVLSYAVYESPLIKGSCLSKAVLALPKNRHLSFCDRSPRISYAPPIPKRVVSSSSGFFAAYRLSACSRCDAALPSDSSRVDCLWYALLINTIAICRWRKSFCEVSFWCWFIQFSTTRTAAL